MPTLVTPEGVSWLTSQVGQPINKFIRDGLDIKVCVIINLSEQAKVSLIVVLAGGEQRVIEIEYGEPRVYKGKGKQVWAATSHSHPKVFVPVVSVPDNVPKQPSGGEGAPGSNLPGAAGGGMGNEPETSLQVRGSPIQQTLRGLSPTSVHEDDGILVSDEETVYDESVLGGAVPEEVMQPDNSAALECQVEVQDPVESRLKQPQVQGVESSIKVVGESGYKNLQKANIYEFISQGTVLSPKGIITRHKNKLR
ncbi:hypothetical protein LINPERPRIM_LOCUS30835 [Linum perenne]